MAEGTLQPVYIYHFNFSLTLRKSLAVVPCSCMSLQEYNLKYVDMIEEQLNEALTTYRKPLNGDNYVRRSNQR